MTLTKSRSSRPDSEPDESACHAQALRALARREHSRVELERKLAARGHSAAVVADTLDRLEGSGLLDAERFCESFVRSRVAKGQGPERISRELAERGIDSETAERAIAEGGDDWAALARRVRRRRFGPEVPVDYKERARQSRFLQYRGFSMEQIRAAMASDPESE